MCRCIRRTFGQMSVLIVKPNYNFLNTSATFRLVACERALKTSFCFLEVTRAYPAQVLNSIKATRNKHSIARIIYYSLDRLSGNRKYSSYLDTLLK